LPDVTRPPQAPSSATVASSVTRVGDGILRDRLTRGLAAMQPANSFV